ncbi:hypothetical protein VOLCADRAFT_100645 [Volvox carteri f. nagariensis]|uniref:Uncharacterized protein n=1 Tax=Volvox carteri f. nagariensis TaxID=3068 RepID=D8UKQ1_VOLCA|nr:uncharacterized protein VOLCADRAFT_100645 [Volvox carteri f. nagariensis]EFJ39702.1 hypothetical protein VOLCADRAFT_100645 [Volvox carteri f. nagariensis]|eukprot:XP_002959242.1 hypothetical protein VOLCADRAFT_100645 [Volvox carteri f. nagariensis]
MHSQREKLAEVQAALARKEQELARERQENVVLRAKAKDDEAQVNYVIEKMKVVTAIQDSIRNSIEGTKYDIGRVDQYRRDLDVKALGQDRDIGDAQMAAHAVTAARDQLAAELRRAQGHISNLQSQLRQAAEESARKDAALERLAADAAAKDKAAEVQASSLQASLHAAVADVAASRGHAEQLRLDLDAERSRSAKAAAQLTERYQEAQQRITELDKHLCMAHNDQKVARERIQNLESQAEALNATASGLNEELANLQAALADRASEVKNATAEAEQLGHRLEAVQAELAGRNAEVQRLMQEGVEAARRAEELISQEAALREELSARVSDVARAEEELAVERERASLKEDELSSALATAQATAAAETARAGAAIAAAEQRLRDAERAAEARLERFKERTSREYDEMRRRVRAEAEAEAKRLAEELKKATAAVQAAESLAANGAAEREEALRTELQALRASKLEEISALKEQVAEARSKARAQAQESKAQYERDLAAALAAAQEETNALRMQLETKHQKERDEWAKEREALNEAGKTDAESRARQACEALRVKLEAKAATSLRDAAAKADKQRHVLEEEMERLTARLQELEDGSSVVDSALVSARERASHLELQLVAVREETAAARLDGETELKRLRSQLEQQLEQQNSTFKQRELEWEAQRHQLEAEVAKSGEGWVVKEEELKHQLQTLRDEVRDAQRQRDQERVEYQQREGELLQAQELERKKLQDAADELRSELEWQLRDVKEELERKGRELVRGVHGQMERDLEAEAEHQPAGVVDGRDVKAVGGGCSAEADNTPNAKDDALVARDEMGADGDACMAEPPTTETDGQEYMHVAKPLHDGDGDQDDVPMSQVLMPGSQRQPARTYDDKDTNGAAKKVAATGPPISSKPREKAINGNARTATAAPRGAVLEVKPDQVAGSGGMKPRPPPKAMTATAGPSKPNCAAGKDAAGGSMPKPSAPRGKPTSNGVAAAAPQASAKAATKGKGTTAAEDGGNAEVAKKGNASQVAAPSAREPLAPQIGGNNGNVPSGPDTKAKDKGAMPPPPPPTVKVPKPVAPPPRFPATQTTTTVTGTTGATVPGAVRKAAVKRRAYGEFADLATESEVDEPSQSQDVTVTGHGSKRPKVGAEAAAPAPSQMPAATKGGRFSLFRGMSMGMSVQTTTADAGGGVEVSSGHGDSRKKGANNPVSKRRKAAEPRSDGGGFMDLFAGMSPYPKK